MTTTTGGVDFAGVEFLRRYELTLRRGRYEIICISAELALVTSLSKTNKLRQVRFAAFEQCDCEGWRFRRKCSHLEAVRMLLAGMAAGDGDGH